MSLVGRLVFKTSEARNNAPGRFDSYLFRHFNVTRIYLTLESLNPSQMRKVYYPPRDAARLYHRFATACPAQ